MNEAIRWGICGTGSIARQFVEAIVNVPDAAVVAVGSETPGRAADFAATHNIERAHDSYAALAADDQVDVVYVASTQQRHRDDTILFLDAGRHVLCEKPFALNTSQAQDMIAAAERNDRFLMEALWSRFLPAYERLGELLAANTIGRLQFVEANFAIRIPDSDVDGHRLLDPLRGGGALLDLGIYPVQLAAFVLGQPDRIHAMTTVGETGVDEATSIILGHPDGTHALLFTSMRIQGTNTARIVGERGSITIDAFMHAAYRMTVEVDGTTEVIETPRASLHYQVFEVHDRIRAGRRESKVMPHRETLALLATLDEVRRQVGLTFPTETQP